MALSPCLVPQVPYLTLMVDVEEEGVFGSFEVVVGMVFMLISKVKAARFLKR